MSSGHVVINGKTYSLAAGAQPPQARHIDGFKANPAQKTASRIAETVQTVRAPKKAVVRSQPAPHTNTPKMRSKTLHRKAVVKPRTENTAATNKQVIIKPTLAPPKKRIERASTISRSPHIGKFSVAGKVEPIPTDMQPKESPSSLPTEPPVYEPEPLYMPKETLLSRQIDNAPITLATALPKRRHKTKAKLVAPVLAVAVVGFGLFAYMNLPSLSMQIAASRAGFDARLPETPSGFRIAGPISYETGQVSVNYLSATDDRTVSLLQKPTTLDSASLRSGFLDSKDIDYQTFEIGGKQVFVYGDSQATWISKGVWYNLDGESRLTTEQILKLVDSL